MKYHTLVKPFLLFSLVFCLSFSSVYASEVTGNLSSDGTMTGGGKSSGSVLSGQSNGGHPPLDTVASGSGAASNGSQTTNTSTSSSGANPLLANFLSADGQTITPPDGSTSTVTTNSIVQPDSTVASVNPSLQTAAAAGAIGAISTTSMIWILVVVLLLIAIVLYVLRTRYTDRMKRAKV